MVTPEGVASVWGAGFGITVTLYVLALKVGMAVSIVRKI